jgi:hypothetical protein
VELKQLDVGQDKKDTKQRKHCPQHEAPGAAEQKQGKQAE